MPADPWDSFISAHPVFRLEELKAYLHRLNVPGARVPKYKTLLEKHQGKLTSPRQGIYFQTQQPAGVECWPDPYLLASVAFANSILAYQTALLFHLGEPAPKLLPVLANEGLEGWVFPKEASTFTFRPVAERKALHTLSQAPKGIESIPWGGREILITTRERTFVDVLDRTDLAENPAESIHWNRLKRLLQPHANMLNWDFLVSYLERIARPTTAARAGFFLDSNQRDLEVPNELLRRIRTRIPKSPCRWVDSLPGRKVSRWNILMPGALLGWAERRLPKDMAESLPEENGIPDSSQMEAWEEELDLGTTENEGSPTQTFSEDQEPPPPHFDDPLERPSPDPPIASHPAGRKSPQYLQRILTLDFSHSEFRPGQAEVIQALLAGQDALAVLPTGSGKTLLYHFVAKCREGTVIVISPLVALMDDQVKAAKAATLNAGALHSGLTRDDRDRIEDDAIAGGLNILLLSPEGLFGAANSVLRKIPKVTLLVVDEAHCISAWGHDFRPAYRDLHNLRRIFPRVPILALTATATPAVRGSISRYLDQQIPYVHVENVRRSNLTLRVENMPGGIDQRLDPLLEFVAQHREESGIVYCATRNAVQKVTDFLKGKGHAAKAYHAGMDAPTRVEVQEDFLQGRISIVVATIAFGMGIHKPDVRFVVHMNLPGSLESYVQEVGRAGRDGDRAECLLFYSDGDAVFQRKLAGRVHENYRGVRLGQIEMIYQVVKKHGNNAALHEVIDTYFQGKPITF